MTKWIEVIYLKKHLTHKYPNIVSDEEVNEWIYEQGLPSYAPKPTSSAFTTIDGQINSLINDWIIVTNFGLIFIKSNFSTAENGSSLFCILFRAHHIIWNLIFVFHLASIYI